MLCAASKRTLSGNTTTPPNPSRPVEDHPTPVPSHRLTITNKASLILQNASLVILRRNAFCHGTPDAMLPVLRNWDTVRVIVPTVCACPICRPPTKAQKLTKAKRVNNRYFKISSFILTLTLWE